tara:strand:+ start:300 stop:608 length:309 start_codon:yes stop_codon:yes gene_type:complete
LERGDEPINQVDALSLHHDLRYEFYDSQFERFNADVKFIGGAVGIVFGLRSSMRERAEAAFVGGVMTVKVVSDVAIPSKRLSQLFRQLKKLKKINKGISVMA